MEELPVKAKTFLSLIDTRFKGVIAILIILLGFCLFGILMFLNIPDTKRELIIFILGNVTGYISLILAYYFGSSEDKRPPHNQEPIK